MGIGAEPGVGRTGGDDAACRVNALVGWGLSGREEGGPVSRPLGRSPRAEALDDGTRMSGTASSGALLGRG